MTEVAHWKQRPTPGPQTDALRALYERIVPELRAAARREGYNLLPHGSMARDLDLLAVPWVADAGAPAQLVLTLHAMVAGLVGLDCRVERALPLMKEHGRLCWTIRLAGEWFPAYIDLGVMPRLLPRAA